MWATHNELNSRPLTIIKVNFKDYNYITTAFQKHEYVYKKKIHTNINFNEINTIKA